MYFKKTLFMDTCICLIGYTLRTKRNFKNFLIVFNNPTTGGSAGIVIVILRLLHVDCEIKQMSY